MKSQTVKRVATLVLVGSLAFPLVACGSPQSTATGSGSSAQAGAGSSVQIPNPFQEFDSLEEAEKAVGFAITLPAAPEGSKIAVHRVDAEQKMIEVIYTTDTSEAGYELFRIRKAPGSNDISGIAGSLTTTDVDAGGKTVTLMSQDGKQIAAIWTDGDYTYALDLDAGTDYSEDEVLALVGAVA